jgi:glycerophosphoryl diester phosphodiesterase
VDAIELDLHVSRDGELVVIHDESLERTTTGAGRIQDLTLEEIRRADAGVKFAPVFRGERVPTLREVVDLVNASGNAQLRLNLELKFGKGREGTPDGFERQVLDLVRQAGLVARTTIQSFYHPSVALAKQLESGIRAGLLVGGRQAPPDPVAVVRQHRADSYMPDYRLLSAGTVAGLHAAGISVFTWTVNDESYMRQVLDLAVGTFPGDGITSDYPDRLLKILKEVR